MPLYEYHCEDCQQDFTLLQSVSANKEESRCSECGSSKVRPKMSTFSSKVTGMTSKTASPVTAKDLPNTKIFDLPKPRHVSEYQN